MVRLSREGEVHEDAINSGMFTPEFRNRLDAIIPFNALSTEVHPARGRQVHHQNWKGQLADRGVMIELTDAARGWLGRKGYDAKMGARPLARTIQEHVKKPLAEELLFGRSSSSKDGGLVRLDVKDDRIVFDYPEIKPPPAKTPVTPEPELVE